MIWNKTFERLRVSLYPVGTSITSSQYSTVCAESITLDITLGRLMPHLATGCRSTFHPSGKDWSTNIGRGDAGLEDNEGRIISFSIGISILSGAGADWRNVQLVNPKKSINRKNNLVCFITKSISSQVGDQDVRFPYDIPSRKFHENLNHS